jgi:hypothetical protein
MNTADILTTLSTNGYTARTLEDTAQIVILGSDHEYIFRDGDYAAGKRTYMAHAKIALAVLTLEFSEPTPHTKTMSDALVKLLAPKDSMLKKHQRPLVRFGDTSTQFIYKGAPAHLLELEVDDGGPAGAQRLFQDGIRFTDAGRFAEASLRCFASNVLIDDAAQWLNDESPLTRGLVDLPAWDRDAISPKVRDLFEKLAATGIVREPQPYIEQRAADYWSHEAVMARQGLRHIPAAPEPAPTPHPDPRVRRAFWRKDARGQADDGRKV